MRLFKRRLTFKTIDEAEEKLILELADQYPESGRKHLYRLLLEQGVEVDPHQLKLFLRANDIGTPPPVRQQPLTSGVTGSGLRAHPWLRYSRWR